LRASATTSAKYAHRERQPLGRERRDPARVVRRRHDVAVRRARRARGRAAPRPRVERRERLVEHEQLGLVQQRAAEREPLRHPARVRRDTLGPHVPEAVALEQHPDPLAPLRYAVEPAVEVEVLEGGQIAVEQRLVPEVPEVAAVGVDIQLAARRGRKPGDEAQQCRLAGSVRARDDEEAAALEPEVQRRSARRTP
jgi:hypothetical protein